MTGSVWLQVTAQMPVLCGSWQLTGVEANAWVLSKGMQVLRDGLPQHLTVVIARELREGFKV